MDLMIAETTVSLKKIRFFFTLIGSSFLFWVLCLSWSMREILTPMRDILNQSQSTFPHRGGHFAGKIELYFHTYPLFLGKFCSICRELGLDHRNPLLGTDLICSGILQTQQFAFSWLPIFGKLRKK